LIDDDMSTLWTCVCFALFDADLSYHISDQIAACLGLHEESNID